MSEFIGIKEGWVERGWTRKQMRDRIEELGLTVNSGCVLQPYELNFMQNPNANQDILEDVELGERAIASSNLWTPGETITIQVNQSSNTLADNFESTVKKYIMQDVQPYVSMKFKFVEQDGQIIVALFKNLENKDGDRVGGRSDIGKQGKRQLVTIALDSFKNTGGKFNVQRATIIHEFGHVLGLNHEFDQKLCKKSGYKCTGPDPFSVMGYWSKDNNKVMDHFSPGDIKWLKSVYG